MQPPGYRTDGRPNTAWCLNLAVMLGNESAAARRVVAPLFEKRLPYFAIFTVVRLAAEAALDEKPTKLAESQKKELETLLGRWPIKGHQPSQVYPISMRLGRERISRIDARATECGMTRNGWLTATIDAALAAPASPRTVQ